jgi:hypothetical protein
MMLVHDARQQMGATAGIIAYTGLQITNPQRLTIDGLNMNFSFGAPPSQVEMSCILLSGVVKTVTVRNCQLHLPILLPVAGHCAGIQAEIVADPAAPLLIENNVFVVNGSSTAINLANSSSGAYMNAHSSSNIEAGFACILVGLTAASGNGTAGYSVKVQNNVMLSLWAAVAAAVTYSPAFIWYLGYRNPTDTGSSMEIYNNLVLGTIQCFVLGGGAPNTSGSSNRHKVYGNIIAPTVWNGTLPAWAINMSTYAGHYVEYGNNWFTGGGGTAAWFGAKYSGTYHFDQGTNKGGIGDQDVTMTSGSDTWQQLNVSLNASAKGMITVILMGRSDAATGNTYFDD